MIEKPCIICGEVKPLDEFYKHKKMGDGHLNKCKSCTKQHSKERHYNKYLTDPSFVEKERERGRERYRRLGYKDRQAELASKKKHKKDSFFSNANRFLKTRGLIGDNENAHHWNYKDSRSVFIMSNEDHMFIHTKIVLDDSLLLFRDKDTLCVFYNVEDHMDLYDAYGIEYSYYDLNESKWQKIQA